MATGKVVDTLELRSTAVFSAFSTVQNGSQNPPYKVGVLSSVVTVTDALNMTIRTKTDAVSSSATVPTSSTLWVDDQYDHKENMEYEFDELLQFARNRVLAPHDDASLMSDSTREALKLAKAEAQARKLNNSLSISKFPENWGMSQFWYTPETCEVLCRAISEEVGR